MVHGLLEFASKSTPRTTRTHSSEPGLTLTDLAKFRVSLEKEHPLSTLHQQIAQGETALGWILLCQKPDDGELTEFSGDKFRIPVESIQQWFGEERLPEGWWDGVRGQTRRPEKEIGLLDARRWANEVAKGMARVRASV